MKSQPSFWMSDREYELVTKKSVIPCVDIVILRAGESGWEVALFIRKTGYEKGKWCIIGGRQRKNEISAQAVQRHASEMGVQVKVIPPFEANFPAWQYDDPNQDKTKHSTDSVYPVTISEGEINPEGPEYSKFQWFSIDQLPEDSKWAYHHHKEVQIALNQLKRFGVKSLEQDENSQHTTQQSV